MINVYGSYAFSKTSAAPSLNGLNLGLGFHGESGIPISEYLAHPGYLNAGEIPVGGRASWVEPISILGLTRTLITVGN